MSVKGSSSKGASVREIFSTMEYGPAPEADDVARDWLKRHGNRFGHYIGGRFTEPVAGVLRHQHPGDASELAQVAQGDEADVAVP